MRVWLDHKKLAYYNLSVDDVIYAIKDQNKPFAVGLMGMAPTDGTSKYQFMISTEGYLSTVNQFKNIIVRAKQNNSHQRLSKSVFR